MTRPKIVAGLWRSIISWEGSLWDGHAIYKCLDTRAAGEDAFTNTEIEAEQKNRRWGTGGNGQTVDGWRDGCHLPGLETQSGRSWWHRADREPGDGGTQRQDSCRGQHGALGGQPTALVGGPHHQAGCESRAWTKSNTRMLSWAE